MRCVWATVILSSLLTACAGLPPLNPVYSAWYIQYEDKKSTESNESSESKELIPKTKLYVVLLNRGTKNIRVKNVTLNGTTTGWELLRSTNDSPSTDVKVPFLLEPGKLVVMPAHAFRSVANQESFEKPCHLPSEVAIVLDGDQYWLERWISLLENDPPGTIRADLVGRMPSELPTKWEVTCALPTVPPKV